MAKLTRSPLTWVSLTAVLLVSGRVVAQEAPPAEGENQIQESPFHFVAGPTTGVLGEIAEVVVPEGYVFAGAEDTQLMMKLSGNRPSGGELGYVAPEREENGWEAYFKFDDTGYVKDDEGDDIDADAILESFKKGTEESNERRRELGMPELHVTGWAEPPRYDKSSHNLVWALKAVSEGEEIINYHTRILGRSGVMSVVLVCDPAQVQAVMPEYKQLLASFKYGEGKNYADYRQGDKVAEYGLIGLMGAGALAVAAKSGILGKLWKFIAIGVLALGAFFKKLFFGEKIRKG